MRFSTSRILSTLVVLALLVSFAWSQQEGSIWSSELALESGQMHLVSKGGITGFIENIFHYFALIENSDV